MYESNNNGVNQDPNPAAEQWGELPKIGDEFYGAKVLAVGGVEEIDPQSAEYIEGLRKEYAMEEYEQEEAEPSEATDDSAEKFE